MSVKGCLLLLLLLLLQVLAEEITPTLKKLKEVNDLHGQSCHVHS